MAKSTEPTFRTHDISRGAFEPTGLEPIRDREKNPYGVRHPFKTQQDRLPKDQRPRHQAAERRRAKGR